MTGGLKIPPLKVEICQFWKHGFIFAKKSQNLGGFAKILADIWTRFDHLFSRFPLAMRPKTLKIFWRASRANFKFPAQGFIFAKNLMNFWRGGLILSLR